MHRTQVGSLVMAVGAILVVSGAAGAQSPSAPPEVMVPVVGPPAGGPPQPPIGERWTVAVEARLDDARMQVAACGDGFVVVADGHDARNRDRTLTWTSPDGVSWTKGPRFRQAPGRNLRLSLDALIRHRGALLALGGDGRRLAVWRSVDCGGSWRRVRGGPFGLGRDAVGITQGLEAASSDGRLLVLARQGGEIIPVRRWAWTHDERGWRRVRGSLTESATYELQPSGTGFLAVRIDGANAAIGSRLVTSTDGRTWEPIGTMPGAARVVVDPAHDRLLVLTHDWDAAVPVPILWSSADGVDWTPVARAGEGTWEGGWIAVHGSTMIWTVHTEVDQSPWTWIGRSEDGGATWSVSAGWPELAFDGSHAIAIGPQAIVIVPNGVAPDGVRVLVQPR